MSVLLMVAGWPHRPPPGRRYVQHRKRRLVWSTAALWFARQHHHCTCAHQSDFEDHRHGRDRAREITSSVARIYRTLDDAHRVIDEVVERRQAQSLDSFWRTTGPGQLGGYMGAAASCACSTRRAPALFGHGRHVHPTPVRQPVGRPTNLSFYLVGSICAARMGGRQHRST